MYMQGTPKVRYEIIAETIKRDDNLLNISYLCKIAGVSRSEFYYWQDSRSARHRAEEQDKLDFDLILAAFKYRGYDKGATWNPYAPFTSRSARAHEPEKDSPPDAEVSSRLADPQSQSLQITG